MTGKRTWTAYDQQEVTGGAIHLRKVQLQLHLEDAGALLGDIQNALAQMRCLGAPAAVPELQLHLPAPSLAGRGLSRCSVSMCHQCFLGHWGQKHVSAASLAWDHRGVCH